MNTSVSKSSNKRKSIGGQKGSPAKSAKLDDSMKSPKIAKVEKTSEIVESKKSPKKQIKPENGKSPKKQIKPENEVSKSENGLGPKLKKFKGTNSIEDSEKKPASLNKKEKTANKAKKPKTKKPKTMVSRKHFLVEKMMKRVETEGKEATIQAVNKMIDSIVSKPEITKTAKKTLRVYKLILNKISGGQSAPAAQQTKKQEAKKQNQKKVAAKVEKVTKTEEKVEPKKGKKAVEGEPKKDKKTVSKKEVQVEPEEEDDDDESDFDVESSFKDVQKTESDDDDVEEESDDEVSDEEEETDEEEDASDEEEKKVDADKVIATKNEKSQPKSQKKSRYVLFIGNIAYDTTKDELKQHFKTVGEVVDVRIPTDKESNRPRGFAYVELADEAAYQKSLDLNGSQLKNRRIKVEYTQGKKEGEDNSKQIKAKNFKLHAMRKQGQKGGYQKGQNKGSPFKGQNKGSPFKGKNRK